MRTMAHGARQVIRAVSDGAGVTPGEIELRMGAATATTLVFGLLRAVVPVMDATPSPASRPENDRTRT